MRCRLKLEQQQHEDENMVQNKEVALPFEDFGSSSQETGSNPEQENPRWLQDLDEEDLVEDDVIDGVMILSLIHI